jgi:FtsH-binding integral membrane protein
MKIDNKAYAVIAGLVLLAAAAFIWRFGFPNADNGNFHYVLLSQIVLVGLALTVVFMAILAIIYSVMGVDDPKQALGLPEGSVRALLAFSLVLIFVCLAAFLFSEVNKNNQPVEGKTLTRVTESQLSDLKTNFVVASELAKDPQTGKVIYEQVTGADGKTPGDDLKHPLYTATYYPKGNKDAEDFAKQIFTTLATIFVSVVSFYFGSSVTTSAAAAAAKAIQGADGKPSALQATLTNALADSHNAQAVVDKATEALAAAGKDAVANPGDAQKQTALQSAQHALDDAKQDLQEKQKKVEAAQKASNDADPKVSKPNNGQRG